MSVFWAKGKYPSFEKFYPDQKNVQASENDEKIVKRRLNKIGFAIHS